MIRRILALVPLLLAAACTTSTIDATPGDSAAAGDGARPAEAAPAPVAAGDALLVVKDGAVLGEDDGIAGCVRTSLAAETAGVRQLPPREFRNSLYPWLEVPLDGNAIAALLARPLTRQRLRELRVRYAIVVGGETTSKVGEGAGFADSGGGGAALVYAGKSGAMLCAVGATGGGCLGMMAWTQTSDLSARVWDMTTGGDAASVSVRVTGTSLMPALVLPVPLLASTRSAACEALAGHLARFLKTGALPEKQTDVIDLTDSHDKTLDGPP